MTIVNIHEAKTRLSALLAEVERGGEGHHCPRRQADRASGSCGGAPPPDGRYPPQLGGVARLPLLCPVERCGVGGRRLAL